MERINDRFNPVDRQVSPAEVGVEHFKVEPKCIALSPDEAWVIKQYIRNVDADSPYKQLSELLSQHFVAGVYETASVITVPKEQGGILAGVYMGIYWDLQDEHAESADIVKLKIQEILQFQPEEVQTFIVGQFAGPRGDITRN